MKFFNTLTRKKEDFIPLKEGKVGIYSCGPTVYWYQHIGHMYAYTQWDVLVRTFKSLGYEVEWVMNLTDVGHMTSDEDIGEDKMEKGAKREGVSVWKLAEKYISQFEDSMKLLNILTPDVFCRATDNIDEQIKLAQRIEKNGFAYETKMGLVFDTQKFPDYAKFANLKLDKTKTRQDVEVDKEKKHPWDFFLWVTGNKKHIMKWPSPWGEGYPGWHIECTAMSTKYLGEHFDIHTGGKDHVNIHHTNEIAQGFAAFGKQTANFWLHNGMLTGKGGEKMSKSLGNFVTTQELIEKGHDPISLRYLFLTSHYRKGLNFSWEALDAAKVALDSLQSQVVSLRSDSRKTLSQEKQKKIDKFRKNFTDAIGDDLNTPQALASIWDMLKSNIPAEDKYDLIVSFDEVLGLNLAAAETLKIPKVPEKVQELIKERETLRSQGKFEEADKMREKIESLGFKIKDTEKGTVLD